jgi:predicted amidohydrolase YtcJ
MLTRRAALAFSAAALAAPRAFGEAPATLITGGTIYPGGLDLRPVEAVIFRGDRIAYVGALADARSAAPGAKVLDLGGATAFPGFVDCHAHVTAIGLREMTLDLADVGSVAELQSRLRDWATAHPTGAIDGAGWIETHWPEHRFPTRQDLDAVVADRPVYLIRADHHAVVVNSVALRLAGVTGSTPVPAGGQILLDAKGEPTGLLVDNARPLIDARRPPLTAAERREAIVRAGKLYASRGWTGMHSMSVAQSHLDIMRALAASGEFPLRLDNYMDVDSAAEVFRTGPSVDPTGRIRLRGIKLYADGALGSRGAALLAPYSDRAGWTGSIVTTKDAMVGYMGQAKAAGCQVAVHAIGDLGNRNALDAIAEALGPGRTDHRWRIEHAQVLSPPDLPRFAAMGVTASMQASHAIGDLYFAPARLGPERLKGAYAWKSLIDSGALVCGGSDAPVEKGDPRIEYYAAAYRHAIDGFAGPDWGLDQALSRLQALRLYTSSAAYAVGREAELGTLAVGKKADMTVFSKDFTKVEPAEILTAKALMTIVDGKVVYAA